MAKGSIATYYFSKTPSGCGEIVLLNNISFVRPIVNAYGECQIAIKMKEGDDCYIDYQDKEAMMVEYNKFINFLGNNGMSIEHSESDVEKKGSDMVSNFKSYFEKHQDVIITIAVVVLLDHFLFNGALRNKIQNTVEKFLDGAKKAE